MRAGLTLDSGVLVQLERGDARTRAWIDRAIEHDDAVATSDPDDLQRFADDLRTIRVLPI